MDACQGSAVLTKPHTRQKPASQHFDCGAPPGAPARLLDKMNPPLRTGHSQIFHRNTDFPPLPSSVSAATSKDHHGSGIFPCKHGGFTGILTSTSQIPSHSTAPAGTHPAKQMIPEVHVAVRLALFQVSTVILGVFMTRLSFMSNGYPTENLDWNAIPLFIRSYGFFLLVVPVIWTSLAVCLENSPVGRWSRRWTVASGLLLLFALAILFLWCFSNPYNGRMRLHAF